MYGEILCTHLPNQLRTSVAHLSVIRDLSCSLPQVLFMSRQLTLAQAFLMSLASPNSK